MIEKLLKQANIPKEWWDLCSVENGIIHTPSTEVLYENGLVSEEEYQLWKSQQIDILTPIKTTEELTKENEQLWDTVEYLLKQVDMIPEE